jgi:HEAT repeat protein
LLVTIGRKDETVVPALAEALKDKEPGVRQRAAEALGAIGPKAKAAKPALTEAARKDRNRHVREAAVGAMKLIVPGG